jgi:hypothetical protein
MKNKILLLLIAFGLSAPLMAQKNPGNSNFFCKIHE